MRFPLWFHEPPTLKHFRPACSPRPGSATWVVNTALVSACVVVDHAGHGGSGGLRAGAAPAAGRGARSASRIFMTYLVPPIILFLPLARVVARLGLMDSWWALVLRLPDVHHSVLHVADDGLLPDAVPLEIEEAAWIDGCGVVGRPGACRPAASACPAIVTTAIFAFTLVDAGVSSTPWCSRPPSSRRS